MTTQAHGGNVPSTDALGARLALTRWQQGWNIKEAALACGVPQASWRGWELDGNQPRNLVDAVSKISERTGVDEYWLLTGRETPRPGGQDGAMRARRDSNPQPSDWSSQNATVLVLDRAA